MVETCFGVGALLRRGARTKCSALCRSISRSAGGLSCSRSAWAGFARYQPLDEPELGAFEQLDREALGLHLLERLAKHMVGPEANERAGASSRCTPGPLGPD